MEGNYSYSLHGTGVSMCSNEVEGVASASSRNLTQGSISQEGTMHCNNKFE